jgi:hypothetical protein
MEERRTRDELFHVPVGIVLLVLTAGAWACLWVPPSS